jgi:hypothetical protein
MFGFLCLAGISVRWCLRLWGWMAGAVTSFHGMNLHHRLNTPSLLVLLQQWTGVEHEGEAQQDVAQQLSQWLHAVDAIQFNRALHAIESMRSGAKQSMPEVDTRALDAVFQTAKADLMELISANIAPARAMRGRAHRAPADDSYPEAPEDFAPHIQRYLGLQKQMDVKLAALRAQVRQWLSKSTFELRQLAVMDEVMERMLGAREQRLWASLPGHLERRLAHRRHQHQQALQTSGQEDAPQRWRQPGGWLSDSEQDLQALLLAEMQVRLQPITGLLEAAHNETTGRQE